MSLRAREFTAKLACYALLGILAVIYITPPGTIHHVFNATLELFR